MKLFLNWLVFGILLVIGFMWFTNKLYFTGTAPYMKLGPYPTVTPTPNIPANLAGNPGMGGGGETANNATASDNTISCASLKTFIKTYCQ